MVTSYASVEPLLVRSEQEGDVLRCTFQCPVTQKTFEADGALEHGRGLEEVCGEEQSLLTCLRDTLGSLFRGSLRPTRTFSGEVRDGQPTYSESERRAAVMLAFQSLCGQLVWDRERGRWIAAEGAAEQLCEFSFQLGVAPVTTRKDGEVLSRMLVDLARADGHVTPTEWAFLAEYIPRELSSVDTAMDQPQELTPDELDEASRGAVRDTLLMLAWSLALADEELDVDERERILGYAKGLRIPESRALELKRYAQVYLFEQALQRAFPEGRLEPTRRDEAVALGARIGLAGDELTTAEERFKKRLGIG